MGGTSKKPRAFYNPETRRKKKNNKVQDLKKQHMTLEKRKKVEGDTKWLKHASNALEKRMKRAGLKTAAK